MASRIERMVENIQDGARRARGGRGALARGGMSSGMSSGMSAGVNVGGTERIVSAVAGGLLSAWGLKKRGVVGWGAAALGAELVRRGATGKCMAYKALDVNTAQRPGSSPYETERSAHVEPAAAVSVKHAETIERPKDELYAVWRDFTRLPEFMHHLERVDVITPTRSHWVAKAPAGTTVEWDAEITDEREGEYIAWRSVEPAQVPNKGSVHFITAPNGRGTEVLVTMEAQPPAGKLGAAVAAMFGRSPEQEVKTALKNFKEIAERGGFQSMAGSASSSGMSSSGMSSSASSMSGSGVTSETESGLSGRGGVGSFGDTNSPSDPWRSQAEGTTGWGSPS